MAPILQRVVQTLRPTIPRGWSFLLQRLARVSPAMQLYKAELEGGDTIVLDLRQKMCHGYFYYGGISHEIGNEALFSFVLKPGSVYVDVGANIGYYTKKMAEVVGPTGTIHAFEPLPSAWNLLKANVAHIPQCQLHNKAVAETPGELPFYAHPNGDTSSLVPSSGSTKIVVPVTTLDQELSALTQLDLLKIDVEGAEYRVLQGAKQSIQTHRPIVCFELLPNADRQPFDDYFAPLDYELHYLQNTDNTPQLLGDDVSSDIVAVPKEKMSLFRK